MEDFIPKLSDISLQNTFLGYKILNNPYLIKPLGVSNGRA
jgi:hypothetical protein